MKKDISSGENIWKPVERDKEMGEKKMAFGGTNFFFNASSDNIIYLIHGKGWRRW